MKDLVAHLKKDQNENILSPHKLLDHLKETAKLSENFASKFDSGDWGKVLGLAHDVGKARIEWQEYINSIIVQTEDTYEDAHLENNNRKVPHAPYGACFVEGMFGEAKLGRFLSYEIAGHHTGLPDWSKAEKTEGLALNKQLEKYNKIDDIPIEVRNLFKDLNVMKLPWRFRRGLDVSLWMRMLFSCLIDSDRLDTERYMDKAKNEIRGKYLTIEELKEEFDLFMFNLEDKADNLQINTIRREIRKKCIKAGKGDQGAYSLTVPTGGGKTLSSLGFALEQAEKFKLDRIIYVIPYTSIIEQTAEVFKKIFGKDQVVEHHSNLNHEELSSKIMLATENWDAPIIITTSVQFFESLFSSSPSKCRKLHNITNSVVILDEAQLVPTNFLKPVLATLQLLVERYGVTILISTATQPAFRRREGDQLELNAFTKVEEIIGDKKEVEELYKSLKRTQIELPKFDDNPVVLKDLASELKDYKQVLCVVSDRKSCLELFDLMPEGTYHLSSLMCGEHRSKKITEISEKLKAGEEVRVISTQLVEAGVDLDFPLVYKSFAGLDSIIQAAGRCNREGKADLGKVKVFFLPRPIPQGFLRKAADLTKSMLIDYDDMADPDIFEEYFKRLYYNMNSLDKKGIVDQLDPGKEDLSIFFRSASRDFKIIDDKEQIAIIVRYEDSENIINEILEKGPNRRLLRMLQRFTVSIYRNEFLSLEKRKALIHLGGDIHALTTGIDYSDDTGLILDLQRHDPEEYYI